LATQPLDAIVLGLRAYELRLMCRLESSPARLRGGWRTLVVQDQRPAIGTRSSRSVPATKVRRPRITDENAVVNFTDPQVRC